MAILQPSKYPKPLQIVVEFLAYLCFNRPLTTTCEIPLRILSFAFSKALVQRKDDFVAFDVERGKHYRLLTPFSSNFWGFQHNDFVTPTTQYLIDLTDGPRTMDDHTILIQEKPSSRLIEFAILIHF